MRALDGLQRYMGAACERARCANVIGVTVSRP
jgi:hypothetical protein